MDPLLGEGRACEDNEEDAEQKRAGDGVSRALSCHGRRILSGFRGRAGGLSDSQMDGIGLFDGLHLAGREVLELFTGAAADYINGRVDRGQRRVAELGLALLTRSHDASRR